LTGILHIGMTILTAYMSHFDHVMGFQNLQKIRQRKIK